MTAATLFDASRLSMTDSIRLTIDSLNTYRHRHLVITWSGGKDSTTILTLVVWLIESGRIARLASLTILYADTRMELTPLYLAAAEIREDLDDRGWIDVRTVMAPLDKRFFVYMLGRGVPPPNNNTLRWCQRQIKIDPMTAAVKRLAAKRGKHLALIGLRLGESAARDGRIALACGTNGAECGQGWYQQELPDATADKLSPILHWRVCHVWEWLKHWAPRAEYGDWSTQAIADAYGGDEAEEINARTGCVGCPLASKDTALDSVLAVDRWAYLAPLKGLRDLYRELREPQHRLRKPGGETRADGSLVANQHRMGPLTFDARLYALERVLAIQAEINAAADRLKRPRIDFINAEEEARIRELIDGGTWPNRWTGDEPLATEPFDEEDVLWPTLNGAEVAA